MKTRRDGELADQAVAIRNLIDGLIRDRCDSSNGDCSGDVVDSLLFAAQHLVEESARIMRE